MSPVIGSSIAIRSRKANSDFDLGFDTSGDSACWKSNDIETERVGHVGFEVLDWRIVEDVITEDGST